MADGPSFTQWVDVSVDKHVNSVYKVKRIAFLGRQNVPIVLQNENGPCPLLAISNVLLLRNFISIHPDSPEISLNDLLSLIAERLLDANVVAQGKNLEYLRNQQQNIEDAIWRLPRLATGIDVNVLFRKINDFEFTPECAIFDLLDISLVHGWIIDPQDAATFEAIGHSSYNQILEKLVALQVAQTDQKAGTSGHASAPLRKSFGRSSSTRMAEVSQAKLLRSTSGDLVRTKLVLPPRRSGDFSTELQIHKDVAAPAVVTVRGAPDLPSPHATVTREAEGDMSKPGDETEAAQATSITSVYSQAGHAGSSNGSIENIQPGLEDPQNPEPAGMAGPGVNDVQDSPSTGTRSDARRALQAEAVNPSEELLNTSIFNDPGPRSASATGSTPDQLLDDGHEDSALAAVKPDLALALGEDHKQEGSRGLYLEDSSRQDVAEVAKEQGLSDTQQKLGPSWLQQRSTEPAASSSLPPSPRICGDGSPSTSPTSKTANLQIPSASPRVSTLGEFSNSPPPRSPRSGGFSGLGGLGAFLSSPGEHASSAGRGWSPGAVSISSESSIDADSTQKVAPTLSEMLSKVDTSLLAKVFMNEDLEDQNNQDTVGQTSVSKTQTEEEEVLSECCPKGEVASTSVSLGGEAADEQLAKANRDGLIAESFLESTASQLTYFGLFKLQEGIKERELCVFFRNNHFSTLFKIDNNLYLLATDQGYMNQPDIVWERLREVDGDTVLVDSSFCPYMPSFDLPEQLWQGISSDNTSAAKLGSQSVSTTGPATESLSSEQRHHASGAAESSYNADLQLAMALQEQELQQEHISSVSQQEVAGRSNPPSSKASPRTRSRLPVDHGLAKAGGTSQPHGHKVEKKKDCCIM